MCCVDKTDAIILNNPNLTYFLIKATKEFFLKEYNTKHINYLRLCISGVSEENISSIADIISVIRSFKKT